MKKILICAALTALISTAYANEYDKDIDKSVSGEKNTHTQSDHTSTMEGKNQNIEFHDAIQVDGTHDRSASDYDKDSKYDK